METLTLTGKSKKKLDLIAELAENLGLTVRRVIVENEVNEEKALLNAMEMGKTDRYMDTKAFLKKLKQ